ncbi:hypothetical protein ABGB18_05160 [Nonomuraea sp. B12E4]|uniref:hypothetical protein n=1 Tax=Nonomuraea sp. B12E4 TaxID=3153564 RepID=UPI00325E3DC1
MLVHRRFWLHDVPRLMLWCRLRGHKPVVDGYSPHVPGGDAMRWVACDLDRELWRRGHRFVRSAEDVRVFVRSKRAVQRVLASVTTVVEQFPGCSATLISGSAAGCGRSAGRNGNASRPDIRTCAGWASPMIKLGSGPGEWAAGSKGYWPIAGSAVLSRALRNAHWDNLEGSAPDLATAQNNGLTKRRMRARMSSGVKVELADFAAETGLAVTVCHFPEDPQVSSIAPATLIGDARVRPDR